MPNSNSLRPAKLQVTKVHADSVRPVSSSPLAGKPGNIASGRNAPVSVPARGSNQPRVYGGK